MICHSTPCDVRPGIRSALVTLLAAVTVVGSSLPALRARDGTATLQEQGPESPLFRFGLIADVQYADKDPVGVRRYRSSLERLERCVVTLRQLPLAFVVELGDIIDGRDSPEESLEDLDRVVAVFDRLQHPWRPVLGNHCLEVSRPQLLPRLGLTVSYQSFGRDGFRFVALDSMDVSTTGRREDEPEFAEAREWLASHPASEHPNAQGWNGAVGEAQKQWLATQLEAAEKAGEKVVVFSHLPLLAAASSPYHLLWNHEEVRAMLEASPAVVAFFGGHDHAGGYALENGIHHVTQQGMVEAPIDGNAFAVVEVFTDRLEVIGYGTVPSRTLRFERTAAAVDRQP